jgi:RNA recognition motif-containing protein
MRIYVGNLPYSYDDQELAALFQSHGEITSARIVLDRESGRSRGFGFIEMADENAARTAMNAMNGQRVDGRPLIVNEARPSTNGGPRREGGGGPSGGYGGGPRPPRADRPSGGGGHSGGFSGGGGHSGGHSGGQSGGHSGGHSGGKRPHRSREEGGRPRGRNADESEQWGNRGRRRGGQGGDWEE